MRAPAFAMRCALVGLVAILVACRSHLPQIGPSPAAASPAVSLHDLSPLEESAPEAQGLDGGRLLALAEAVRDSDVPILSLLISRHDRLVFELYTSSVDRNDAHYQMSITKSVLSALVGMVIDQHLVASADAAVGDVLPRGLFTSDADQQRHRAESIKDVMGMSALDSPLWPQDRTEDAIDRLHRFEDSPDRVRFAVDQPLLPAPSQSFQYNDVTPMLAVAVVQCTTGESALDFAAKHLFEPMGFRNYEWEGQDRAGFYNGGYGLRLRPVDMQKFGLLYLHHGAWGGRQLLSSAWVDASFVPWIRSDAGSPSPNYGSFWWTVPVAPGWIAHAAQGWRGQKIVVFPEQEVVITMTADIEDGSEDKVFSRILKDFVVPAVETASRPRSSEAADARLTAVLAEVQHGPHRAGPSTEFRMIPSKGGRVRPRPFDPATCTTAR